MRTHGVFYVFAMLLVPQLAGCGTVSNLASKDPYPFGGVERDVGRIEKFSCDCQGNAVAAALILGYWGAEFTATLVGDVLTLPLARHLYQQNHPEKAREGSAGEGGATGEAGRASGEG